MIDRSSHPSIHGCNNRFFSHYDSIHTDFFYFYSLKIIFFFSQRAPSKASSDRKKKVREAAEKFKTLTAEERTAELQKITDLLKYKYLVAKQKKGEGSEAYKTIKLIYDARTHDEIYCFHFCPVPFCEEKVFFSDTSNGTGKILNHHKRHEKQNAAAKASATPEAPTLDAMDDDGAEILEITPDLLQAIYVVILPEITTALAEMSSVGFKIGELQKSILTDLLPDNIA